MQFVLNLHQRTFCGALPPLYFRATRYRSGFAMSTSTQPSGNPRAETATSSAPNPPLVMQIVVRRDLLEQDGWGVGPLMAQVSHATAAVLHETKEQADTQEYLADLSSMRKSILQVDSLEKLQELASLLNSGNPPTPYHLWIEQPENIPTCLAVAPNRRSAKVKKALHKTGCILWKG